MDERLIPVREAITDRQTRGLTSAVNRLAKHEGYEEAHRLIHQHILPNLDPDEIYWFWNSVASPVQTEKVTSLILKDAALFLIRQGYIIGQDFSFSNGKKRLLLGKAARDALEESLPRRKLVMLSLVTRLDHVKH
jgi:hypothetical protein